MNILLINKYFYPKGGSEISLFNTAKILEEEGHHVSFFSMLHPLNIDTPYSKYFVSNVDFERPGSFKENVKTSMRIVYSLESRKKLEELLKQERPDIVHLHNIHHQISPSILYSLKKFKLPVVMTLHDYKMVCPTYRMVLRGRVCERCRNRRFFHCTVHRCHKNSVSKSILNTLEMYLHSCIFRSYTLVDVFISPSQFLKNRFWAMGFPGKIIHLPNFVFPDEFDPSLTWGDKTILYFGRLSREKGIYTLLQAMEGLPIRCKIFGDGPEKDNVQKIIKDKTLTNTFLYGFMEQEQLKKEVQNCMFVVLPSEWYENLPFSVIESFALGKPVVGANIGGIPELIRNEKTGMLFEPGNVDDLKKNILYLLDNSEKISKMGRTARTYIEQDLNPKNHYRELIKIYNEVLDRHK